MQVDHPLACVHTGVKKLAKLGAPDVHGKTPKDASSNASGSGRMINENKVLSSKKNRFVTPSISVAWGSVSLLMKRILNQICLSQVSAVSKVQELQSLQSSDTPCQGALLQRLCLQNRYGSVDLKSVIATTISIGGAIQAGNRNVQHSRIARITLSLATLLSLAAASASATPQMGSSAGICCMCGKQIVSDDKLKNSKQSCT